MKTGQVEEAAFRKTAEFLSDMADPWWVLGSGAIALLGLDPKGVRDIDVLISKRDALVLMQKHNLPNRADGGNERFRSDIFLLPELGDFRVELMSNYCIRHNDDWVVVQPSSRIKVQIADATLYVPALCEQIELLSLLGRPKDHHRIQLLKNART